MIVKTAAADRFVARPPGDLVAALVFGPDWGLVRERAGALVKSVVPNPGDPFRTVELDGQALVADNARLFDEAAAISMFGGRRAVRVGEAGNTLASLFETFLDNPKGDALVVVEAGDLPKSASLRKVFADARNAAAIECYPDSASALGEVVRSALKADGLSIEADALEDVVSRLGTDRGVTRRELEKLALYMRGIKRIALEDVRAIIGDAAEARAEAVCDAAGEGDFRRLDIALERLWAEGMTAVGILWVAMAHFRRLLAARIEVERGAAPDAVMKRMRVHFARENSFRAQVSRWSEHKLLDALDLLFETESLCKATAVPTEAVCGRALFGLAAMAREP